MTRPPRKAIPTIVKAEVFARQDGRCAITKVRLASVWHCHFDHHPPLGERPVNDDGTDLVPPQLDPDYIYATAKPAHRLKTDGPRVGKPHMLAKNHDKARILRAKRLEERRLGEGRAEKPPRWRWGQRPKPPPGT